MPAKKKPMKVVGTKGKKHGAKAMKSSKKNPRRQTVKKARLKVSVVRKAASQPKLNKASERTVTSKMVKVKPVINNNNHGSAIPRESMKTSREVSKLSKAELEHFRSLLLDKRREILGDVGSMESEAFKNQDNHSSSPMHMADVGTDNFEQEFTLGLIESERHLLKEIQDALNRIDEGTFGVCVATGKLIGKARLEAKPWANHCIEYARMLEQGLVGRDTESESREEESEEEEE